MAEKDWQSLKKRNIYNFETDEKFVSTFVFGIGGMGKFLKQFVIKTYSQTFSNAKLILTKVLDTTKKIL